MEIQFTAVLDSGEKASLRDCEWVFYEPCGCPRGVMSAVILGQPMLDEDTAFREFFDDGYKRTTLAMVKRERKRGVTAELMTTERYRAEISPAMRVGLHKDGVCPRSVETLVPKGDLL